MMQTTEVALPEGKLTKSLLERYHHFEIVE
jgi:hypothetical protein